MNNTKFALVLKQCRENAHLTQKQVASALGMERSTYAYYETGVSRLTGLMIVKLALLFNVSYDLFMEAIADFKFDKSENAEGYTSLTDNSWAQREKMYSLPAEEQNLLLCFRLLEPEQKVTVISMIKQMNDENLEKEEEEEHQKKLSGKN